MLNKLEKLAALPNLSDWEAGFLTDLIDRRDNRQNFVLSEKQTVILQRIETQKTPK